MVEGESEEVYFNRIARLSNRYSIIPKISKDKRCDDIVINCMKMAKRLGLEGDDIKVAVFDLDVVKGPELERAITLADENDVILMPSNLSFEVWLLMHLEDVSKVYTQEDYEERLSRHLNERYRKSRGLRDNVNIDSVNKSIKRGERSLPDADPKKCLESPNTSTLWRLLSDILNGPA